MNNVLKGGVANGIIALMVAVIVVVFLCVAERKAHREGNTDEETQKVVPTERKTWIEGEAERSLATAEHRGHLYVVFFGPKNNVVLHSPECPCHKDKP